MKGKPHAAVRSADGDGALVEGASPTSTPSRRRSAGVDPAPALPGPERTGRPGRGRRRLASRSSQAPGSRGPRHTPSGRAAARRRLREHCRKIDFAFDTVLKTEPQAKAANRFYLDNVLEHGSASMAESGSVPQAARTIL